MIDDTLLDAEERMDKALSVAREDLGSVRTGRAAPSMFNKIVVDYYGAPTPIPQMASITVPEARMAVIKPYDTSQMQAIERAIRDSDLGVNPTNDGSLIRVVFPQLTEERRRELVKVADATAISLCMDNSMPIVVFNLQEPGTIARAVAGERIGTLISDPA